MLIIIELLVIVSAFLLGVSEGVKILNNEDCLTLALYDRTKEFLRGEF